MNKRIFAVIILIMVLTTIAIVLSFSNKSNDTEPGSDMAIMIQNESNNSEYDIWKNETWPDGNQYQLNIGKSNCSGISVNGNNIEVNTNTSYKCNLFFDKKKEPLSIVSVDVDNSVYNTLKLMINAKGGSGNYTYSLEDTCNEGSCYTYSGDECTLNGQFNDNISINNNVITITEISPCYTHNFKIKVKDASGNEATFDKQKIDVLLRPGGLCMARPC